MKPPIGLAVIAALGLGLVAGPSASAGTVQVQENSQIGSVTLEIDRFVRGVTPGEALQQADIAAFNHIYLAGIDLFGLQEQAIQVEGDPLVNLRLEIENHTDETQFYAYQIRFETDVTAGPTFQDAFANIELFDANGDGFARVSSSSTFFDVVSDSGGIEINGSRSLGARTFFSRVGEGKETLFDKVGTGPNSDDFEGPGFNYMRFVTNGYLSPGDKVVITGMGAYATDAALTPDRFEIPAVPEPTTGLLAAATGLALLRRRRG